MEKTGEKRPWKSLRDFHFSHSFNNNKLDDRDHFQQNAKTSVASLRGLIGSSRNIDRHHSGMLIAFIGIPSYELWKRFARVAVKNGPMYYVFTTLALLSCFKTYVQLSQIIIKSGR